MSRAVLDGQNLREHTEVALKPINHQESKDSQTIVGCDDDHVSVLCKVCAVIEWNSSTALLVPTAGEEHHHGQVGAIEWCKDIEVQTVLTERLGTSNTGKGERCKLE